MNKEMEITGMEMHHIGLLVEDLKSSISHYSALFGVKNISETILIDSQKVKVCFVKIGTETYIELVEPQSEDSPVYKLLKKRVSYYHLAYKVEDIESVVRKLEGLNYKALHFFNSEAFGGKKCIFLFTPEAHLIELVEK